MIKEWERLFELCHNPIPDEVEVGAIIVPTGDWLERAKPALALFKSRFGGQERKPHLVVTGGHGHPDLPRGGASAYKVVRAMKIFGRLAPEMKGYVLAEVEADNTKEQAENVYGLFQIERIAGPLVVVVSDYHLPRLISTFLATIMRNEGKNLRTRVYSVPVPYDENRRLREPGPAKKADRILAEVDRIHRYRKKGDVATKQALTEYVQWLRSQHQPR